MTDFKWKRRGNIYTITDAKDNLLFTYDILIEKGPPPKKMKHPDVLKEIELRLKTDFGTSTPPVDQSGTITV